MPDFKELYASCRSTLFDVYNSHSKHTSLSNITDRLDSIVECSMEDAGCGERELHEFLVLVLYSAYYKILGIDSDRLEALEFGYKGCARFLKGLLVVSGKSEKVIEYEVLNTLLSVGRDESFEEYISNSHYIDDVKNINDLLNSGVGAREVSIELRRMIGAVFASNIKSALKLIDSRYSYLLEGTFGIDNYKGIYTGRTSAVMQGVSRGIAKVIEPDIDFATKFKPIFDEILDASLYAGSESNGRQFDLEQIASNFWSDRNAKPTYFPFKMLEFMSKCGRPGKDIEFTTKTQLLNYIRLSDGVVGSKEKYLGAIQGFFEAQVIEYIRICLALYCCSHFAGHYDCFTSDFSMIDTSDFDSALVAVLEDRQENIAGGLGFSTMRGYVVDAIWYFVDCVTTAVVLDKCETAKVTLPGGASGLELLEFRFKVCARLRMEGYSNMQFIQRYIKLDGLNASDMPDIEDTEPTVDDRGFTMVDIKYTFDMDKVNARPMFAYKALGALRERGSNVDWQSILLGRDLRDKIVTSGVGGDICLQDSQVHWIISGSRSGKGVMCYNIFATALGAGIPIFYLDRKPDTATVMNQLSGGRMFCVNGGQYDSAIDVTGEFSPDRYSFQIPSYLQRDFADMGRRFDFVYFRSLMLVLAMFDYADTYKDSPMGQKLLGAFSGGVVLVLDEFSNFISECLAKGKPMSSSSGSWLSRASSQKGMVESLQTVSTGVKKAQVNLMRVENKKGVTEAEIEMARDALSLAESAEFDMDRVYWAAVADAYRYIKDSLGGKKDAAGAVAKSMQIFVIGQDFSKIECALAEPDWFNTGAAGNRDKFIKSDGIIPLVHLLGGLSSDVITGYQADRAGYLGQGKYSTKNKLNTSRRCFAYKKMGSFSKDELRRISNTEEAFKGNESQIENYLKTWKYFKPFLILNNAEEPPAEVCVRFDENSDVRLNVRKGVDSYAGVDQSACRRSQYVGQCISACEDAGLSWDDLLAANNDGTGHLDAGVGFEGYISQLGMAGGMAVSGDLATEFVQSVYGYSGTWEQFVCDFRPEWIVSTKGYTADGARNVVQDRLSDSFFFKGLLALSPAKVLGDKLESLLPYYSGEGFDNVGRLFNHRSEEPMFVADGSGFEGVSSCEGDSSREGDSSEEAASCEGAASGSGGVFSCEGDSSGEAVSFEGAASRLDVREKRHLAEFLVAMYLEGVKSVSVEKYKKLGHPALRGTLLNLMYDCIERRGL